MQSRHPSTDGLPVACRPAEIEGSVIRTSVVAVIVVEYGIEFETGGDSGGTTSNRDVTVAGAADVPISNSSALSQATVSDEHAKERALARPLSLFRVIFKDELIRYLRAFGSSRIYP